jgi:prefoldin subunit 5
MELGAAVVLKYVLELLVVPAIGIFIWVAKRLVARVEKLEDKVNKLDKHTAVHESVIDDIHADIRNIENKLDRILDRLMEK